MFTILIFLGGLATGLVARPLGRCLALFAAELWYSRLESGIGQAWQDLRSKRDLPEPVVNRVKMELHLAGEYHSEACKPLRCDCDWQKALESLSWSRHCLRQAHQVLGSHDGERVS